jgi:hypothetical protein
LRRNSDTRCTTYEQVPHPNARRQQRRGRKWKPNEDRNEPRQIHDSQYQQNRKTSRYQHKRKTRSHYKPPTRNLNTVEARPLCYRTACSLIEIASQPKLFTVCRRHLVHSRAVAADNSWRVNHCKSGITTSAQERSSMQIEFTSIS